MLFLFLLYNINQLEVYVYPLPLETLSHLHPLFHSSRCHSGEGNGNPLQYSCLENSVDRGAWWAAVHRVAQSRTRLKRPQLQQQQQPTACHLGGHVSHDLWALGSDTKRLVVVCPNGCSLRTPPRAPAFQNYPFWSLLDPLVLQDHLYLPDSLPFFAERSQSVSSAYKALHMVPFNIWEKELWSKGGLWGNCKSLCS